MLRKKVSFKKCTFRKVSIYFLLGPSRFLKTVIIVSFTDLISKISPSIECKLKLDTDLNKGSLIMYTPYKNADAKKAAEMRNTGTNPNQS